jgi:hypothetical protein
LRQLRVEVRELRVQHKVSQESVGH